MSSAELLEKHFNPFLATHPSRHLAAAVVRNGTMEAIFSSGFSSEESPEAVPFRIASMSKSFAAAATLVLRDEGRLRLTDPAGKYVPELKDKRLADVTVFHLLTMQTGLPTDDPWADRLLACSDADFDSVLRDELLFVAPPGEQYHYSNLSYMLLGRIISRASGEHALMFIKHRLLEPLGMKASSWQGVSSDAAVFGGLTSTLADMARWMDFFLDAEANTSDRYGAILARSSRRDLQRGVVILPPRDETVQNYEPSAYAFGLRRFANGRSWSAGHSGGLPGWGCHMRWSSEHQCGVVSWADETYSPVAQTCRAALAELCEAVKPIKPQLSRLVSMRAKELLALSDSWSDEAAESLFASNFFLDNSREVVREKLASLPKDITLSAERGAGATLIHQGGSIALITLAPAEGGRIQELKFLRRPE